MRIIRHGGMFVAKREKVPGVFIHTHVKTGCFYVGTSVDVYRGAVEDKRRLFKGEHFNPRLQKLYDEDSELVTSVEVCETSQVAKNRRAEITASTFSSPLLLNKACNLNVCAVYRLTHVPTGHFYIGSTNDFTNRRSHHEFALATNSHSVKCLQDLYNADPRVDTLSWDVQLVSDRELAYTTEQRMLDLSKGDPLLLNLSSGVYGRGGYVMSSEEKEAVRKRFKQQWTDPAFRTRFRERRTKPVIIEGTTYPSYKDAAMALDIKPSTVHARIMSKSNTWTNWTNS